MEIFKTFSLECAHRLPNVPQGHKCARVHGHSFKVELHVRGPVDGRLGWVMDFADIKQAFEPLHEQLDHRYLNEVDGPRQPDEREACALDLVAPETFAAAARARRRA